MDELVSKKRHEEGSVTAGAKDSSIMHDENLVVRHADSLHSLKVTLENVLLFTLS